MSAPELTLTIAGFVARNAEIRYTQAGTPVAQASVPYTPRRRTPDGRWEDAGETVWVDVKVWQKDAEKFAQLATKGTYLTATGRPRINTWTSRDGKPRTALSIDART